MFLIMFSLSAFALSSVQGTWENQIWMTHTSFDTVLANQSESAQSFLAKAWFRYGLCGSLRVAQFWERPNGNTAERSAKTVSDP